MLLFLYYNDIIIVTSMDIRKFPRHGSSMCSSYACTSHILFLTVTSNACSQCVSLCR